LQLLGRQLFRPLSKLMTRQALDQQPQLVILGRQLTQHLLQRGQIVRQCVRVDLHAAVMNDVSAPVPELFCRYRNFLPDWLDYPANSGRRRSTGARHSQPSSKAASCAEVSVIRPDVSADGQTNCPRSSRLVNMHNPIPSC